MKHKINKYLLCAIQFLIYFALFYVLFSSSVNMVLFPFAFGMFFALAWANQRVWLLAPAYILAGALYQPTLEFAICVLTCVFCLVVPYFVHILCKKPMKKWEVALFAILSQTANVVFDILGGLSPVLPLVSIVIGVIFMFACIAVFEAIIIRGFTNKLTILEIVSLFAIIAAICGGLYSIQIENFSFLKLFMSFVLLIFSFCATAKLTLLVAAIGGLGTLIATNNPIFFAPFMLWALVTLLFKKRQRIFMVIGLLCVEVLVGFYFALYPTFDVISFLPVAISSAVFLLLPKKFLNEMVVIFNYSKDRLAMKNVVNRNRELLHKRIGDLSEVFNDMNIIYRNMLKKGMDFQEVKVLLEDEIKEKICSFCPERNHCHRTFAESTKKVFDQLITISYEKGRATLLDIPSYLTSRCKQTSAILGSVNTLTAQYKKYINLNEDVDTSKLLIADQLLGISKVLTTLSKEMDTSVSFDTARENKILDELAYHNIICIDAVVFEKDEWTIMASVVVRDDDCEKPRIVDAVSRVCGCKMAVCDIFSSARPGFSVVNMKTAPKYDCLFGVSQHTKNGSSTSGDTYSVVKLDSERLLFAISDGMGSGEKAEQTSELSISLVENFYKAGFDNDLILSTVNKLLALHKQEIFSALDICVLDEKNGLVDFIKMASPKSYLLTEDACEPVEAGALPIGIVKECKPLVSKQVVGAKDFVIMISDGIADSFENDEEFESCIKSIKTKNPQEFADELLSRALACNNGYAVDDMTVIVVKILDFQ